VQTFAARKGKMLEPKFDFIDIKELSEGIDSLTKDQFEKIRVVFQAYKPELDFDKWLNDISARSSFDWAIYQVLEPCKLVGNGKEVDFTHATSYEPVRRGASLEAISKKPTKPCNVHKNITYLVGVFRQDTKQIERCSVCNG
jgi:hypothetical protein